MRIPNTDFVIENNSVPKDDDPAEQYLEATKIFRETLGIDLPNVSKMSAMKEVISASKYSTKSYSSVADIALPKIDNNSATRRTLYECFRGRVSAKQIEKGNLLSLDTVSWLLWAADGVSHEINPDHFGRTAPSGGALYPRDVYLICSERNRVESLPPGTWHYNPYSHCLELVTDLNLEDVFTHEWHVSVMENAQLCVVVAGSFWRNRFKYNLRGTRFTHIEAGMVTQNLLLAGTAANLQVMPFGGYFDNELSRPCRLDGLHESPLSVVLVGGEPSCR